MFLVTVILRMRRYQEKLEEEKRNMRGSGLVFESTNMTRNLYVFGVSERQSG